MISTALTTQEQNEAWSTVEDLINNNDNQIQQLEVLAASGAKVITDFDLINF